MSVDELIVGINMGLRLVAIDTCPAFDALGDESITIDELVVAVRNSLAGCRLLYQTQVVRAEPTGPNTRFDGPFQIAVSPGGEHVYVVTFYDPGLTVLESDPSNRTLSFVEAYENGESGVEGLVDPRAVDVSPDGLHVYVADGADALSVFERNTATGRLSFVEVIRDGQDGVGGLGGPEDVKVSPDGAHVYATGEFSDSVAVFERNPETGRLVFVEAKIDNQDRVKGLEQAQRLAISPHGADVYVAGATEIEGDLFSSVASFERNSTTGALSFLEVNANGKNGIHALVNAESVAVSGDGENAYVTSTNGDAIIVFDRGSNGKLSFVQAARNGDDGVRGLAGAFDVAVSPDGNYVYATGSFDDAVVIFGRNERNGKLSYAGAVRGGENGVGRLRFPRGLEVSRDGTVYVASLDEDALTIFAPDPKGGLSLLGEVVEDTRNDFDRPLGIAVSPGGEHVYVASIGDNAVVAFAQDPDRGKLTFIDAQRDGMGGVEGLIEAVGVSLSPDGNHVYATGIDTVVVFARDRTTGTLNYLQTLRDGENGVNGIAGDGEPGREAGLRSGLL